MKRSNFGEGLIRTSTNSYITRLVGEKFAGVADIASISGTIRWVGDPIVHWWVIRHPLYRDSVRNEYDVYVERAGITNVSHWIIKGDSTISEGKAVEIMIDAAEIDMISEGIRERIVKAKMTTYADTDKIKQEDDDVDPERLAREDPAAFKRIYLGIETDY